jgi:hypothetical protein
MKQQRHPSSRRGIAVTEYLVILALVAVGAITVVTAYARSQKVALATTVEAMAGGESSQAIVESSPPQDLNLANFSAGTAQEKPNSSGTMLDFLNSTIRSVLPEEYASRFRGLDNPDWARASAQALSDASLLADITPGVGTVKAVIELATGEDPLTGEEKSRIAAAVGVALSFIPGGRGAESAVDVVQVTKVGSREIAEAVAKESPELIGFVPRIEIGNAKKGLEHILVRHSPNSAAEGASKFALGMGHIEIKAAIREAAASGSAWRVEGSKRVLDVDMGRIMGAGLDGQSVTGLRVVTDSTGNVITAYPIPAP